MASEECGLATAAAKVDLSLWTGSAWLRHPFGPAKSVKAFGFFPDPGERLLADIIKSKPGDFPCGGARQHGTTRIDGEIFSAPAVHTRFRATGEVVG